MTKGEEGRVVCTGGGRVRREENPANKFLSEIQNCQLPAVSWVIPNAPQSDHARSADGSGPAWVAAIVNALGGNRRCGKTGEVYWKDTAIFITWDDWGGWFDHVPPYRVGQRKGWGSG